MKRTSPLVLYLYHFARFKIMYTTSFKLDGQGELEGVVQGLRSYQKYPRRMVTESEKQKAYQ